MFGYVTLPMGSLFDFRNGLSKGKDFFGSGIPFILYTDVYNNRFLNGEDITDDQPTSSAVSDVLVKNTSPR